MRAGVADRRRGRVVFLGVCLTAALLALAPEGASQPASGWGTPVALETAMEIVSQVDVAMDGLGNAVAVWRMPDAGVGSIWSNRFVLGTGWGAAELLELDTGTASRPGIALDADGDGVAVWIQFDGIRNNLWASRYAPGVGWGTPELLEVNNNTVSDPVVAMSPGGSAVAVWRQSDGTAQRVWAARLDAGTGWGAPLIINAQFANVLFPKVAMDAGGNATAVWAEGFPVESIYANRYTAGAGWGTAQLLETGVGTAQFPRVAMASGEAIAVWAQSPNGLNSLFANRFFPGTGWGTATEVDVLPFNVRLNFDVKMDGQRNAVAAWEQLDAGSVGHLYASRFVPASGWGVPEAIESFTFDPEEDLEMAMDTEGNAMVVWRHAGRIVANRFLEGVGWGTAEPIDVFGAGDPFSPQVAMDPEGNAMAAWVQFTGTQDDAMANRFRVDDVPPALTITSPTAALTNDPSVTVAGTTEPGAAVTINGEPTTVEASGSFSRTFVLADGTHEFVVVAADIEGNTNQTTVTITVDTVAPLLALTSPTAAVTNNPQVTAAGVTEPGAGVTVDGVPVSVDVTGAFSHTLTLPEGTHNLVVVATDAAGNSNSVSAAITVDTTAPSLSITGPAEGTTTQVASVTITGLTEPGVDLFVNGLGVPVAGDGTFGVQVALAEGPNTLRVTARDVAGNVATASVNVTYTNPIPTLENDLAQTMDDLSATQASLQDTQQTLSNVESGLAAVNATVSLLLALLIVFAGATSGLAFLLWNERRRARGGRSSG